MRYTKAKNIWQKKVYLESEVHYMKTRKLRLLSALLALAMLFALMPTAAFAAGAHATSGTCGATNEDKVTWTLDSDGTLTISGEGKIRDASKNNLPWPYPDEIKKVIVENGVTEIGRYDFYNCTNLTEVDLNNVQTLENIRENAFSDCSSLSTVKLPMKGKLKSIDTNAFGFLDGVAPQIREIMIPASVKEIRGHVFNGCKQLENVEFAEDSKLETIYWNAFESTSLKKITIPASVTTIEFNAFRRCEQLKSVTFAPGSRLKKIGRSAFQYTAIEEVRIPASVEQLGTEPKYGSGSTFYNCSNLKKVVFESPSKLNYVSNGNFNGCSEDLIICCMDKNVIEKLTETGDMNKENVDRNRIKPTYPTVTFDFDNGSDVKTEKVENGKTISAPAAPTKDGYVFAGWYTDKALTQKYDFSKPVIDDMTLYAKWEEVPVDTYVVTVENGVAWVEADAETEAVAAGESICVPEGVTVHVKADETAFDGMAFERWEVRKGEVKLADDRAAETSFTMPAGEVQLEAMYQTKAADVHDSGWDAATVVTGAVIGTGTAILAYHIGMEVYAEQVLGKDVAVPRTRAEVALLAWQLAGSPAVNGEGEPLSEAAQAEKWAVESGLMEPAKDGSFAPDKKMSKWSALRVLDAAKKMG